MAPQPLEPNKIHRLPVKVIYHLPSSSQSYVTILADSHNVYVHQRPGSSQLDESWGSMNLKAVARGVCFASPEIVPSSDMPDSSLYVLDPRETHLRRSRSEVASPSIGADMWTGKGMLSWACAEPGDGKTLVTGRLSRFRASEDQGLEALYTRGDNVVEWGLEVSLGVRSFGRTGSDEAEGCTPLDGLFGKSVVIPQPRIAVKRERTATPGPDATISQMYKDPASLTEAQAQRLLASPHFLTLLKKMSNDGALNSIPTSDSRPESSTAAAAGGKKKKRKADGQVLKETQKQASVSSQAIQPTVNVCYNCGRTKSAVWRMKIDGGEQRRVCNACGLYWNKMKQMRPPELWEGVDEDVTKRPRGEDRMNPSSSTGYTRGRQTEPSSSTGFKRTLTTVVENDAKRYMGRRNKAATITSPVRASTSAASSTARRESSPGSSWQLPRRTAPKRAPVQSLDLPLSDDGQPVPAPQTAGWDENLSAFFDLEEFAPLRPESPPQTAASSPDDPTANFLRSVSSGARQRRQLAEQQAAQQLHSEDDDGFSVLFRATSSVAPSSSPAHIPFDFSQLPPSSPPIMPRSKAFAPSSPARPTPKAFTPDVDLYGNPIGPSPADMPAKTPAAHFGADDMQALLSLLTDANGNASSSGLVEGELDVTAFLDSLVTE